MGNFNEGNKYFHLIFQHVKFKFCNWVIQISQLKRLENHFIHGEKNRKYNVFGYRNKLYFCTNDIFLQINKKYFRSSIIYLIVNKVLVVNKYMNICFDYNQKYFLFDVEI